MRSAVVLVFWCLCACGASRSSTLDGAIPDDSPADAGPLSSADAAADAGVAGSDVPELYASDRNSVFALNELGRELWRKTAPDGEINSLAVGREHQLHLASGNGDAAWVSSYDLASETWTRHLPDGGWVTSVQPWHVAVWDRFVFANNATIDGRIAGLVWFDTRDDWHSGRELMSYAGNRYFTVGLDGWLYVEHAGALAAFDAMTRVLDRMVYFERSETYSHVVVSGDGTIFAAMAAPCLGPCFVRAYGRNGDELDALEVYPPLTFLSVSRDGRLVGVTAGGEIAFITSDLSDYRVIRPSPPDGERYAPHRVVFAEAEP